MLGTKEKYLATVYDTRISYSTSPFAREPYSIPRYPVHLFPSSISNGVKLKSGSLFAVLHSLNWANAFQDPHNSEADGLAMWHSWPSQLMARTALSESLRKTLKWINTSELPRSVRRYVLSQCILNISGYDKLKQQENSLTSPGRREDSAYESHG